MGRPTSNSSARRCRRPTRRSSQAIALCRSAAAGRPCISAKPAGSGTYAPRSCGNRHCPGCQQHKGYAWLARQLERQLPTHYFMLTFTVPEPLRAFLRSHQRIGYGALFEASSGAIKALAADQNHLGADTPGFFGVLHTWGRQLSSTTRTSTTWCPAGHYRARIRAGMAQARVLSAGARALADLSGEVPRCDAAAGLLGEIPAEVWSIDWNVNCQAVGEAAATLRYLARYVFQVAITERRILRVDHTHVHFQYRKPHSSRVRTMALPVMEFMRRFLQHVLPRGFMKVRYYGFLSPSFGAPRGRQSSYRNGQRVCAGSPRGRERATGGPALSSLRWRTAILPPAPGRRLRARRAGLAWSAGRRVVHPQRPACGALIRAARPLHPRIASAPPAARRPIADPSRDPHGAARTTIARHPAPWPS